MSNTNVIENFIAGSVGGVFTVATGQPFDTVKVKIQTMPHPKPGETPLFTGALDCVKKTVKKEGFFALYKGMAAPLVTVTPSFAVFLGGCALGRWIQQTKPGEEMTFIQNFNAGALGGLFSTIVTVPGERIKCVLQVQSLGHSPIKYDGPLDVVEKLYKEGGIRSIYRGTAATLFRGECLKLFSYIKGAS
uniref:Mitochondrial carnitine/acylcarnitine carrier protein n=1 Tax=Panagrolaimus sp. JU765 TaxID=591449 RepID=A0AC34Q3D3_9BILA